MNGMASQSQILAKLWSYRPMAGSWSCQSIWLPDSLPQSARPTRLQTPRAAHQAMPNEQSWSKQLASAKLRTRARVWHFPVWHNGTHSHADRLIKLSTGDCFGSYITVRLSSQAEALAINEDKHGRGTLCPMPTVCRRPTARLRVVQ